MNQYFKDKPYLLPLLFFSSAVFVGVVSFASLLPTVFEAQSEVSNREQSVSDLTDSVQTLNSISDSQLNTETKLVNDALPEGKDVAAVFAALSEVASKHNVTIDGFTLDVGDVFIQEGVRTAQSGVSQLQVDVTFSSPSTEDTEAFVTALYEELPLAEVDEMRVVEDQGRITINFFYKDIDFERLSREFIIPPRQGDDLQLLQTIQQFEDN